MSALARTLQAVRDRIPKQEDGTTKSFAELMAESEAEDAKRFARERMDALHKAARIPQRYAGAAFDGFDRRTESIGKALDAVLDFSTNWPEHSKAGRCLVLTGEAGTGKTHLGCALVRSVCDRGLRAHYVTFSGALKRIRDTWGDGALETELQVLNEYRNAELLVIDEVGMQRGTEAEQLTAFDIIDGRYSAMKSTLVLTNCDVTGLSTAIGTRAIDRLMENGGRILKLTGKSARLG